MPWRHMDAKSERLQFVRDARNEFMSFTELCALYQIGRTSGYKWVKRAGREGPPRQPNARTNCTTSQFAPDFLKTFPAPSLC